MKNWLAPQILIKPSTGSDSLDNRNPGIKRACRQSSFMVREVSPKQDPNIVLLKTEMPETPSGTFKKFFFFFFLLIWEQIAHGATISCCFLGFPTTEHERQYEVSSRFILQSPAQVCMVQMCGICSQLINQKVNHPQGGFQLMPPTHTQKMPSQAKVVNQKKKKIPMPFL